MALMLRSAICLLVFVKFCVLVNGNVDEVSLIELNGDGGFSVADDQSRLRDIKNTCNGNSNASGKDVSVGCNVFKDCENRLDASASCSVLHLWALICSDVTENVYASSPCRVKYVSECSIASNDKPQCVKFPQTLPTTPKVKSLIASMCKEMPGMRECKNNVYENPFFSYNVLCGEDMKDGMAECKTHASYCKSVGGDDHLLFQKWNCIQHSKDERPEMKMFLHFSMEDYILFEAWVPRSTLAFILSLLAIFLVSMFDVYLKQTTIQEDGKMLRAMFFTFCSSLDLLIMLIVMSFNGFHFLAVMAGFFVGNFFFLDSTQTKAQTCHC